MCLRGTVATHRIVLIWAPDLIPGQDNSFFSKLMFKLFDFSSSLPRYGHPISGTRYLRRCLSNRIAPCQVDMVTCLIKAFFSMSLVLGTFASTSRTKDKFGRGILIRDWMRTSTAHDNAAQEYQIVVQ